VRIARPRIEEEPRMTNYSPPEHVHNEPVEERSTGWTGYAAVKYGFIFLIVLAILYFVGAYLIPAFR
jgi:hypothetical protein